MKFFQGKEQGVFEKTFSVEVMRSERIRAICVAVFVMLTVFGMTVIHSTVESGSASISHRKYLGFGYNTWIISVMMIVGLYELLYAWIIGRNLRRNKNPSIMARSFSTIVEVSIPTIIIFVTWESEQSIDALFSVASYLYFIFIALNALRLSTFLCVLSGVVAGLEYLLASHIIISKTRGDIIDVMINTGSLSERVIIITAAGAITGFVAYEIRRRIGRSTRKIEAMNESFARFVPSEFLSFLSRKDITEVSLGDQSVCRMTLLFADIRSFTTLSERTDPQEMIDFLNEYFCAMSPVIHSHNGFIDKYIGDAIMAVFPGRVEDAVAAAVDMQLSVSRLNETRASVVKSPIAIGVGIHQGMVVLGTVGDGKRLDTTVIADAVNVASRLESLTKDAGEKILVSRETMLKVESPDLFKTRDLGNYRIRGREDEVAVVAVDYNYEVGA
jgi:class 3 adenylate cyclase